MAESRHNRCDGCEHYVEEIDSSLGEQWVGYISNLREDNLPFITVLVMYLLTQILDHNKLQNY